MIDTVVGSDDSRPQLAALDKVSQPIYQVDMKAVVTTAPAMEAEQSREDLI